MEEKAYEQLVKKVSDFVKKEKVSDGKVMSFLERMKLDVVDELVKDRDGLFVIKKKGWLEEFNEDKLMANIATASDDIKQSLTESELTMIIKAFRERVAKTGIKVIPTIEIMNYIEDILSDLGYERIREYYRIFNGK